MPGWYDGPREGIADFQGKPHLYESLWDEKSLGGCWTDLFMLTPLDAETFELALEDWQIWCRWEAAFKAGNTTLETHPALPEDRHRHKELKTMLSERFEMSRK